MPDKITAEKAKRDLAAGKSPSTAAGEFVREEIEHIREGKHGARSTKQAIAIGLSEARRAGVPLKPPAPGRTQPRTRRAAERAYEVGQGRRAPRAPSAQRGEREPAPSCAPLTGAARDRTSLSTVLTRVVASPIFRQIASTS
jgi:hypothetical protein